MTTDETRDQSEVKHFAPYGSTNAACDETVPRGALHQDATQGVYSDPRFTEKRAETTCQECRWRANIDAAERKGTPTDEQVERVALAIRAEMRPERMDSGPIHLDHDVHEYIALAYAALAAAVVAPLECQDCGGFGRQGDGPEALGIECPECSGAGVAPPAPSETKCWCFDLPRDEHHADCEPEPALSGGRERLVAEARAIVDRAAHGTPSTHAARIRAGDVEDERLRIIVQLADALAAPAPVDEAKLAEVVDNAQRRWNGSGRREPIATAITRDVVALLRGDGR